MQYYICVYYYSNVYYRVINLNPCILTKLDLLTASAHEIVPATVHELRQIVRGLKNKKEVGNDGIKSEVYKFASERLLTIMSISLS